MKSFLKDCSRLITLLLFPLLGMAFTAYGHYGMLPLCAIGLVSAIINEYYKNDQ